MRDQTTIARECGTECANGDSLRAMVGASGQRCFKVACAEPVYVVYRKVLDGSPVLAACKQHQDLLATKLKWQIEKLNT